MRSANSIPIRRVIPSTPSARRPFNPQSYPVSPSIEHLLAQPTWSVRSLLPPESDSGPEPSQTSTNSSPNTAPTDDLTPFKLSHLLRLSALPQPKSPAHAAKMLKTLRSQVHFVKAIQSVNTTDVEPLITIRDETAEAIAEETVTLEKVAGYLALEEKVGVNGTVRRRDETKDWTVEEERRERRTWEVDVEKLGMGSDGGSGRRMRGRYFFVKRGKGKSAGGEGEEHMTLREADGKT